MEKTYTEFEKRCIKEGKILNGFRTEKMTKEETKIFLENNNKKILNSIIQKFYNDKKQADYYKKSVEELNKNIKNNMKNLNITEFESENLIAKITTQKRESFNNDKLLSILEKYKDNIPGLIVMQPTIDMDKLEDAIYNDLINAIELQPAREVKEVVTLKVSERKD